MSSTWSFLKKIFHIYTHFFTVSITFLACLFIYFIGISIGSILHKFSNPQSQQSWQKIPQKFSLEAMF